MSEDSLYECSDPIKGELECCICKYTTFHKSAMLRHLARKHQVQPSPEKSVNKIASASVPQNQSSFASMDPSTTVSKDLAKLIPEQLAKSSPEKRPAPEDEPLEAVCGSFSGATTAEPSNPISSSKSLPEKPEKISIEDPTVSQLVFHGDSGNPAFHLPDEFVVEEPAEKGMKDIQVTSLSFLSTGIFKCSILDF